MRAAWCARTRELPELSVVRDDVYGVALARRETEALRLDELRHVGERHGVLLAGERDEAEVGRGEVEAARLVLEAALELVDHPAVLFSFFYFFIFYFFLS